ncbi:MAG: methyltransferase domain-containing protein [Deltaproteobacteria bacterium]|nr:methyltransferase domain-containing protein [Deltaproteobacteria bacterium]
MTEMKEKTDLRQEIMLRAEEGRRAHLAAGVYTAEEEDWVAGLELKLPRPEASIIRRLEEVQARVNQSFDPLVMPQIFSHRPGLGRLIVAAKRLVFKLTRFYSTMILTRQADFNRQTVETLNDMVEAHRQALEQNRIARQEMELLIDQLEETEGRLRQGLEESEERLKRELDEIRQRTVRLGRTLKEGVPAGTAPSAPAVPAQMGLSESDYVALEDRHRGSTKEIRAKLSIYVDLFSQAPGPVLDLGCGRGEFLGLLAEAGIEAQGVDLNREMVGQVRAKGLEAETADGLAHLQGLAEASLGGLFMAQVIEHLPLAQLTALLEEAFRVLAPEGLIVAETINPQSLSTFAGAFYVDPTHLKPVHPLAATFLWESTGFKEVRIIPANPYSKEAVLQMVDPGLPGAEKINENFARLNGLIYAPQDYAVVGRR